MDPLGCRNAKAPRSQSEPSPASERAWLKRLDSRIAQSQTSLSGLFENGWMIKSVRKTSEPPSFVYAARCKRRGLVKIGSSSAPYQRVATLAPRGWLSIEALIAVSHTDRLRAERCAQWQVIGHHVFGEWFSAPALLVSSAFHHVAKQKVLESSPALPKKRRVVTDDEMRQMKLEGMPLRLISYLSLCSTNISDVDLEEQAKRKGIIEKEREAVAEMAIANISQKIKQGWSIDQISKQFNIPKPAVIRMSKGIKLRYHHLHCRVLYPQRDWLDIISDEREVA